MELRTVVMAQEQEVEMAVLEETTVLLVVVVVASALMPVLAELKLLLGDKVEMGDSVAAGAGAAAAGEAALPVFQQAAVAAADMLVAGVVA
jgi:hypothetical protein